MEEKIIEAQFTKNKVARIAMITGVALIVFGFFIGYVTYSTRDGYLRPYTYIYDSFVDFFIARINPFYLRNSEFVLIIYIGVLTILLSLFFVWKMSRCSLIVTNRRVTGKASFGKAIDIPLNQISAVGIGVFNRITVATSSGKIHFWLIKNRSDVHSALTEIIGKAQVESAYAQNNNVTVPSNADELKKFKELLDNGVITQEEFDAKKKQLLGL